MEVLMPERDDVMEVYLGKESEETWIDGQEKQHLQFTQLAQEALSEYNLAGDQCELYGEREQYLQQETLLLEQVLLISR